MKCYKCRGKGKVNISCGVDCACFYLPNRHNLPVCLCCEAYINRTAIVKCDKCKGKKIIGEVQ